MSRVASQSDRDPAFRLTTIVVMVSRGIPKRAIRKPVYGRRCDRVVGFGVKVDRLLT
jgi:hypothetical protein